jgi:hypothetical protein
LSSVLLLRLVVVEDGVEGLVSGGVSSGGISGWRKAARGLRMEVKMSLVRSMVGGSRDPGRVAKMVGRTMRLFQQVTVVEVAGGWLLVTQGW